MKNVAANANVSAVRFKPATVLFVSGCGDKHIGTIDADGVALAAIQGLHQMMQQKDAEIEMLKGKTDRQEQQVAALRRSVELLLARTSPDGPLAQK